PLPTGGMRVSGGRAERRSTRRRTARQASCPRPFKEYESIALTQEIDFAPKPILPRWAPLQPRLRLHRRRLPPRRNGCNDFPLKKSPPYPPRPGLGPSHQTLLLCSSPEIGPSGGPRTHGGDVRAALSNAVNLTPRHTPGAAARSAPESPRTTGGAPPPPPAGR